MTTARLTSASNCLLSDGLMVIRDKTVWMDTIMVIPQIGASALLTLENILGKNPSSAEALNTWAIVNCQPNNEPVQDIMAISGHKTEKVFYNYIKVDVLDNATRIADNPFFQ